MLVILATVEAEIKTITVQSQPRQNSSRDPILKKPITKKGWCLYSYPYLNQQKPLFLPMIAYTLSSTKLEIRAK
jgi:hypothetical protein